MATSERYAEVITGIDLIWNNKFDEADKLFETKKESPRYALHYAESAFLRSFITADVEDTQLALQRLKFCKNLAEEQMKPHERVTPLSKADLLDTRIAYGDALYMIAILQMTRDAKIKGAFNLRKSWKVFEKALKESKEQKDLDIEITKSLHFGAGFFLFAMSIIPQKFLKLVELAGFKADRDAGLHYLKEVQKDGGIRGPFATMLLLFNNLLLPRGLANADSYLIEADQLIQESLKKYPEGSLFHVMGSHCARKQCNIEKGIKLMDVALENSKTLKPPLIYRYELANCYCMTLDFHKAAEIYAPLIDVTQFQVRILCSLQLAGCYVMTGETGKATQLFQKLANTSTKSSLDNIVIRQAKRYVNNGGFFAAFELLYLRRDLAKMIPIMKDVLEKLDKMASSTKGKMTTTPVQESKKSSALKIPGMGKLGGQISFGFNKMANPFMKKGNQPTDTTYDDRAAYLLLRGSIVKALGKHDEAVNCFREVVDILADLVTEKLYIPYCLYELGECYYIAGQIKDAEEMMKRCGKYSGYDWEDPLRVRLKVTMEQLKKGFSQISKPPISLDALADQQLDSPSTDEPEGDDSEDYKLSESDSTDENLEKE